MSEATPFDREIHQRLLDGDETASSELASTFLEMVLLKTRGAARRFQLSEEQHWDAAADAVLKYGQRPAQYQPEKGALLNYLVMSAYGDIKHEGNAQHRRRLRTVSLEAVGFDPEARNGGQDGFQRVEERESEAELQAYLEAALPDPKDRRLAELIIEGRSTTPECAVILDITHLDIKEQRVKVNQHKDRIKKRLQRYGGRTRGSD